MKHWFLMVVCLGIWGCSLPAKNVQAPQAFSVYQEKKGVFRAISADGVLYRIRSTPLSDGDIGFWKKALKTRMVDDAGYHFVREQAIEVDGVKGYELELQAPIGQTDYTYWIVIFKQAKNLVIVEGGGEIGAFNRHRQAMLVVVKRLRF